MSGSGNKPLFEQIEEGPKVCVKFASQPPVYFCERCGGTQTIKLPKGMAELKEEMNEFEQEHIDCGESDE